MSQSLPVKDLLRPILLNWPRIGTDRLEILERSVREFTDQEIMKGVDTVLRKCDFPPTVADLYSACRSHQKRQPKKQVGYKPGDIVHGEQTMTPVEAKNELERMHKAHPEAFRDVPAINYPLAKPEQRRAHMELMIHRIYISALRRCARLDPSMPIVAAEQRSLF